MRAETRTAVQLGRVSTGFDHTTDDFALRVPIFFEGTQTCGGCETPSVSEEEVQTLRRPRAACRYIARRLGQVSLTIRDSATKGPTGASPRRRNAGDGRPCGP